MTVRMDDGTERTIGPGDPTGGGGGGGGGGARRRRGHGHVYLRYGPARTTPAPPTCTRAAVFSHGWPLSADDWDAQMLFFLSRLSSHRA